MLSRLLGLLAGLVAVFGGFVATRPGPYRVERSTVIAAPVRQVYGVLENLQNWPRWSPWEELDPDIERTFRGPRAGIGAQLAWRGNSQVGKGTLRISAATPPTHLHFTTRFEEPWQATMESDFHLRAVPQGSKVSWVLSGKRRFWGKLFTLFYDLDQRAGADLERGLARLQKLVAP